MARKNRNGLIMQQVRKISAERWESKGGGNFILLSGGFRMAVRSERAPKAAGQSEQGSLGCCQQMSAETQPAEIQESKNCLGWS